MALIYIDTNVYLDFYQSATDRLSIFKEIQNNARSLIITEQTHKEFLRNRVSRLSVLTKEIAKSVSTQLYTTALVREMDEYSKIIEHQKSIQSLSELVCKKLRDWQNSSEDDPVLIEFASIAKNATYYATTESAFVKAKRRKLLGNPPVSPDKYTIGDELIWETLLETGKDDLIIVSRDQTFTNNFAILKEEYKAVTRKELLHITKSLSDALKAVGAESKRLEEAEQEVAKNTAIDARSLHGKCPECGGALEETGYEGSDGDSAWWLFCIKCSAEFFPN